MDGVEELAHVARPVVADQAHHHGLRHVGALAAEFGGILAHGMGHQERDVLAALAERRNDDLRATDPVVEVLAEAAVLGHLAQVAVGGADEPHVGLALLVGAEADHVAGLQHPQQLGLHGERHVADLVEEQRALVGELEHALAVAVGPRERTANVAEELVLEEALRLAGGVEGHVAAVGPAAGLVDGGGHQFLAGAALAADEDGDAARGHLPNQGHHLAHGRAVPDDPLEAVRGIKLPLEPAVLVPEHHRLGGALHQVAEHHQVQRLLDEVVRPALQGLLGGRDVAVGGDHDGLGVRLQALGQLQDFQARRGTFHHQVGDDDVECSVPEFVLGLGPAVANGADVAWLLQGLGHGLRVTAVIVHQQDLGMDLRVRRHGAGL